MLIIFTKMFIEKNNAVLCFSDHRNVYMYFLNAYIVSCLKDLWVINKTYNLKLL